MTWRNNPNFRSQPKILVKKSKIWAKLETLDKTHNFGQKYKSWINNPNVPSKPKISVTNQNFGQNSNLHQKHKSWINKPTFRSKPKIFDQNLKF